MITSTRDGCDTGRKTISTSVRAWWKIVHSLSNFRETFFIVFPSPNVTVNALCSCPGDARRGGNDHHYFRLLFFFFVFVFSHFSPLWRQPPFSSPTLVFWLMEPADLSRNLKICSLCLHPVILPAFVTWVHLMVKVMRADFLIGYGTSGQTHIHELMKWVPVFNRQESLLFLW